MLVHVVVALLVSRDLDADELFVRGVSDLISMFVDYLDDIVPFVKILFGAEPAKVITLGYDDHCLLRGCPLEVELEVPWGFLVSGFCKALVELDREVLSCGWETV
jgi:hypothetical protein